MELGPWHRCGHVTGFISNTILVHFGGWDGGNGFCGDCWEQSICDETNSMITPVQLNHVVVTKSGERQLEVKMDVGQNGRLGHTSCMYNDSTMYVFGGMTVNEDLNDLWCLQRDI